jgi:hypothetical protein
MSSRRGSPTHGHEYQGDGYSLQVRRQTKFQKYVLGYVALTRLQHLLETAWASAPETEPLRATPAMLAALQAVVNAKRLSSGSSSSSSASWRHRRR